MPTYREPMIDERRTALRNRVLVRIDSIRVHLRHGKKREAFALATILLAEGGARCLSCDERSLIDRALDVPMVASVASL